MVCPVNRRLCAGHRFGTNGASYVSELWIYNYQAEPGLMDFNHVIQILHFAPASHFPTPKLLRATKAILKIFCHDSPLSKPTQIYTVD